LDFKLLLFIHNFQSLQLSLYDIGDYDVTKLLIVIENRSMFIYRIQLLSAC